MELHERDCRAASLPPATSESSTCSLVPEPLTRTQPFVGDYYASAKGHRDGLRLSASLDVKGVKVAALRTAYDVSHRATATAASTHGVWR